MKNIKLFLKKKFPVALGLYHQIRLTLKSLIDYPFDNYLYIENTKIKVPIHNSGVYGLSIGGGRVYDKKLYYEEDLVENTKEYMKSGKVFFDVGAHIGYWSYLAASKGMRVAAFEPVKRLTRVIAKTKIRHDLPITILPHGNNIDDFVEKSGMIPFFIKVDVDGEEEKIINGARNTLRENLPSLLIELRSETLYLIDELKALGYIEQKRWGEESISIVFTKKA